jgi:hypothetical protein
MFVDMVTPGVRMWGERDLTGLVDLMLKVLAKGLPVFLLAGWSNNTKVYTSSITKVGQLGRRISPYQPTLYTCACI